LPDLNLNQVIKGLQAARQAIGEEVGYSPILVLGETGVGKSTFLNALDNATYVLSADGLSAELSKGQEITAVGDSLACSQTLYPKKIDIGGLCFADVAGMDGTRDTEIELPVMLGTYLLARQASGIKAILYVIDYNSLLITKGAPFGKAALMLSHLLKDDFSPEKLASIYFVMTKLPPNTTKEELLEDVIEPFRVQYAEDIENGVITITDEVRATLSVLDAMSEHPDHLFIGDIFDPTSSTRNTILTAVRSSVSLKWTDIDLLRIDKHQQQFHHLLTFLAKQYNLRTQRMLLTIPAELRILENQVAQNTTNIAAYQNAIEQAEQAISANASENPIRAKLLEKLKEQLRELKAQLEALKKQKEILEQKLVKIKRLLTALDTAEAVIFNNPLRFNHAAEFIFEKITGDPPGSVRALIKDIGKALLKFAIGRKVKHGQLIPKPGRGEFTFRNSHAPAPAKILGLDFRKDHASANFGQHTITTDTTYEVKLTYPLGATVNAEVYVKLASRDIPANKIQIAEYQADIISFEACVKAINTSLERLKEQIGTLEQEIIDLENVGLDKARHDAQLENILRTRPQWIRTATESNVQLQQQIQATKDNLRAIKLELKVNQPLFDCMVDIITMLDLTTTDSVYIGFMAAMKITSNSHHPSGVNRPMRSSVSPTGNRNDQRVAEPINNAEFTQDESVKSKTRARALTH